MPQPRHDRSTSRCDRSKSNNHSKQKHPSKPQRPFLPAHELRSFDERPQSPPHRQKQPQDLSCRRCDDLRRKGKEREEHFKQIIGIYHQEMDKLKEVNDSLRVQLEALHLREQQARQQVQELRQTLADCRGLQSVVRESEDALRRKKQLELCISPIEKGKEPIIIQRISEKLLSELESPTFSQLLAGTPQVSKLEPIELPPEEKENALRLEFDRLMSECESTSNRSKKTTLRKQMACIANQLSALGKM